MNEGTRTALKIVGGIAAFVAAAALVWLVTYWLGVFNANVKASSAKRTVTARVQQKVRGADFAQAAYEQFFTDCNAVVADNAKIILAKERVAEIRALPSDQFGQNEQRLADAITDLTGLQQAQADTAARYNAAAAEYTRGQFKAAALPPTLDPPYNVVCQ